MKGRHRLHDAGVALLDSSDRPSFGWPEDAYGTDDDSVRSGDGKAEEPAKLAIDHRVAVRTKLPEDGVRLGLGHTDLAAQIDALNVIRDAPGVSPTAVGKILDDNARALYGIEV